MGWKEDTEYNQWMFSNDGGSRDGDTPNNNDGDDMPTGLKILLVIIVGIIILSQL